MVAADVDRAVGEDLAVLVSGDVVAHQQRHLAAEGDVATHQNSKILADLSIDIRGDHGNLDTGGDADEFGTTMILRGRIIADCVVTPGPQSGHPVLRARRPPTARSPGA